VKTTAEKGENKRQLVSSEGASGTQPIFSETRESAMRRYFYDSLASYLSLYVRGEDQVVEIDPRSKALACRFANYRAVSSIATLKTAGQ